VLELSLIFGAQVLERFFIFFAEKYGIECKLMKNVLAVFDHSCFESFLLNHVSLRGYNYLLKNGISIRFTFFLTPFPEAGFRKYYNYFLFPYRSNRIQKLKICTDHSGNGR
jgi:hypothetical protein